MSAATGVEQDTLIRGGLAAICDVERTVKRADVLLRGGRIAAVGASLRAPARARVIDARDCIVMPGLVQAHVHLCQTLFRGAADDLPLLEWLERHIWPLEAAHDDASLAASAEVGLAELLLGGTTTLLELGTVFGQDVVFEACVRSGIRVVGGKTLMDTGARVPRRLRESTRASLKEGERLERAWGRHPSGRVGHAWIPRFILSCTERLVRGAFERARDAGTVLHTHASEHPGERAAVRRALGADDIELLLRWGLRGPRASIAHGVQLTDAQMKRLAARGVGVVHCPSANAKLGSGMARVRALRDAGVVVGIGADGAPCNNNLDGWLEMRHAALFASLVSGPGTVSAEDVLHFATLGGARLLGLDREVGSLEVGKRADVIVVRRDAPHAVPFGSPASQLVFSARAGDVEHVFVDGRHVVARRELRTLDLDAVVSRARREASRLRRRAGV